MIKNQKGFIGIILAIVIAVAAVSAGGAFVYKTYYSQPKQTACTEEAKLCPDGSSVGRTGPSCDFAACPSDQTAGWKTYKDENVGWEIQLPVSYSLDNSFNLLMFNTSEQNTIKKQIIENNNLITGNFYLKDKNESVLLTRILGASFEKAHFGRDAAYISLGVSIGNNKPTNVALVDYVKNVLAKPYYSELIMQNIAPYSNIKTIDIAGKTIVSAEPFIFEGCPTISYFIENSNKNNYIHLSTYYCFGMSSFDLPSAISAEINQILSAFKFTK